MRRLRRERQGRVRDACGASALMQQPEPLTQAQHSMGSTFLVTQKTETIWPVVFEPTGFQGATFGTRPKSLGFTF